MSDHGRKADRKPRWETDVCSQLPSTPGIYIIWFEGHYRAYIGQSINIAKRVRTHLYEIQAFKNHNMRYDLDALGRGALRVATLEEVSRGDDLAAAENYWMGQYRRGGWNLYNSETVGKRSRGRRVGR